MEYFLISPRWGIRIFAIWALVLTFLALARLLVLTQSVELTSNVYGNQAAVWLIFGINVFFGVGFTLSVYGLWLHHNWGRTLFLWTIAVWAGFNIVALFIPGVYQHSNAGQQVLHGIRYILAIFIPMFYFNRVQIKAVFHDTPQNSMVKDLDNA